MRWTHSRPHCPLVVVGSGGRKARMPCRGDSVGEAHTEARLGDPRSHHEPQEHRVDRRSGRCAFRLRCID